MAVFTTERSHEPHTCGNCGKAIPIGSSYLRVSPHRNPDHPKAIFVPALGEYINPPGEENPVSWNEPDWEPESYCDEFCFHRKEAKEPWR